MKKNKALQLSSATVVFVGALVQTGVSYALLSKKDEKKMIIINLAIGLLVSIIVFILEVLGFLTSDEEEEETEKRRQKSSFLNTQVCRE